MADSGSKSASNASDEIFDILCEPCQNDGKRLEAEGYCSDCSEYLCLHCYNYHRKLKVFQNHALLDRDKMPRETTSASVQDACLEKCSSHKDKTVEFYCGSCDAIGCNLCITLNHRQCLNVDHIPDIAKGMDSNKLVRKLSLDIDRVCQQFGNKANTINVNIAEFGKMCIRAKAELKRHRIDVNKYFDRLENVVGKQISDKEADITKEMEDILKDQVVAISDLEFIKSDLEAKMKNGQNCELFIAMRKAKNTLERNRDDVKKESPKKNIEYIPSLQIEDMMKKIRSLGNVVVRGSEKLSTAKLRTRISVSTRKDKLSAVISGLCLVSEYCAVVVDNANKSVKVVDLKRLCVASEMSMATRLWDVTMARQNQVALTLPDQKKIQFLTLSSSGSLSKDNHINVQDECAGIACCRELLVVSFITYVQILDLKGVVKRKILTGANGDRLFERALYLVISADLETIYVSDNLKNSVIRVTLDGKVKDTYTDLTKPYGILVNNEGSVFVSSLGTSTIHQLSVNCGRVGLLNMPVGCMHFSCNDNKIYAGGFGNEMYIIY